MIRGTEEMVKVNVLYLYSAFLVIVDHSKRLRSQVLPIHTFYNIVTGFIYFNVSLASTTLRESSALKSLGLHLE